MEQISPRRFQEMMRRRSPAVKFKKTTRNKIAKCRRDSIGESQNWRCCYCGARFIEEKNHPDSMTMDHIIPKSHGGSNHTDNLVAACYRCNSDRQDSDPMTYYEAKWITHE